MTLDIAGDVSLFDNTQQVTVTLRRSSGETVLSEVNALRRRLDREERRYAGVTMDGDSTVWHIAQGELDGHELQLGDVIQQADGVCWYIRTAELESLATRWRLICVKGQ